MQENVLSVAQMQIAATVIVLYHRADTSSLICLATHKHPL